MITFEEFMDDLKDVPFEHSCFVENYLKTTACITEVRDSESESLIKNMIHHFLRKGIDVSICQYLVFNKAICDNWRDFVVSNFKVLSNLDNQKVLEYPGFLSYRFYYPGKEEYITHIDFHKEMAKKQNKPNRVNIVCVSGMIQKGTFDLIHNSVMSCDKNVKVIWWKK